MSITGFFLVKYKVPGMLSTYIVVHSPILTETLKHQLVIDIAKGGDGVVDRVILGGIGGMASGLLSSAIS